VATGAPSGIGEALAATLAADGRDLATTTRRGDRLRALAARLASEHGVQVQTRAADLTNPGGHPARTSAAPTAHSRTI
jgi:uncharacterized protein